MDKKYIDSLIIGSCLGDGGIEKAIGKNKFPCISFTQCLNKENDYIKHKHDLIEKFYQVCSIRNDLKKNTNRFRISSKERILCQFIQDLTRGKNNKRKLPTGDNLKYINEIVLLYWYLDDGSLAIGEQKRKNRKSSIYRKLRIALQSFEDKEILEVMNYINITFNLNFKPFIEKNKIVAIGISNNIKEISKFLDLIKPYKQFIPKCMHYKFCLCFKPTIQIKDTIYKKYNECNFINTGICTCRNKDLSHLL